MKKNIIYTLCILLSGAFFFSSCEDMLETESTSVDGEFGKLTLNDSVYSVLGIVKSLQNIGDRQVVLGELRADLVSVVENKATLDLQKLSRFEFDEDNQYLDIKDYYTVINNCNVFLSRVDTTIIRNNKKAMLGEFLAVTSVRAWTYLQLAINYDKVRYFTRPLLTHGDVKEEMEKAPVSREELMTYLIEELTPYENPRVYSMPSWSGVKISSYDVATEKLFVPIRYLLGELHLWRGRADLGDYSTAAEYFYKMLSDSPTSGSTSGYAYYTDNGNGVGFFYSSNGKVNTTGYSTSYNSLFKESNNNFKGRGYGGPLALIPYQTTTTTGSISNLSDIFLPEIAGQSQVVASQGYIGLSNRQVYYAYDAVGVNEAKYNPVETEDGYIGDLRRYEVTGSTRNTELREVYNDNILKHCYPADKITTVIDGQSSSYYTTGVRTRFISLYREAHIFMRLAEALLGMERFEGYTFLRNYLDKKTLKVYDTKFEVTSAAMDVLKRGFDYGYIAIKDMTLVPATPEQVEMEEYMATVIHNADTVHVTEMSGNSLISYNMNMYSSDPSVYTDENDGMHARGSGNSENNKYYALNDTCIARYNGELVENADGTYTFPAYTKEDSLSYVADLLLDELALEFCFEGYRFGDLVRFAKAAERAGDPNWKDILVKRVAGRGIKNNVSYRASDYVAGDDYNLNDENNWYLPFPNSELLNPEDTYNPTENPEEETPEQGGNEETPGENESGSEETPKQGTEGNE